MRTEAHAATEEAALPRLFGRYVLFDHIGRGGMADIYLARLRTQLGAARNVVVKQILPALSGDPDFAAMLIEEAKLAAQLNHANIVQVFDLGREEEQLYIAMDYVEGFDLRHMLAQLTRARVALPAEFALLVVREVLRGLDYAHRACGPQGRPLGIVHRDVSPSNVLISFEGEVKLCDFGIARALGRGREAKAAAETQVRRGRIAGKAAYMSPEQARGEEVDPRADVFAAGIILWELCAGRRLYRGTEEEMLAQARAGQVPPLPDRGLPEHERLERVVARALTPDPAERFESAAAFLEELEDYAIACRLMASPLRFGAFLVDHFAEAIVGVRRAREKAADALDAAVEAPRAVGHTVPEANEVLEDPAVTETQVMASGPESVRARGASVARAVADQGAPAGDEAATEPPAEPRTPTDAAAAAPEPATTAEAAAASSEPPRRGLEPFTGPWFAAVAAACLAVGLAVYFALR